MSFKNVAFACEVCFSPHGFQRHKHITSAYNTVYKQNQNVRSIKAYDYMEN